MPRKHYTQMSDGEVRWLMSQVRGRTLTFHSHAMNRMKQKRLTELQVRASIGYCSVVEAHNDTLGELRVLVRGKVLGNFVCAVISLTRREVITCYWNQRGDHHKTIDMAAYTWTVDLLEHEETRKLAA